MMTSEMDNAKVQAQYEIYKVKQEEKRQKDEVAKFVPPFKRLSQKELLECLEYGWTGRFTRVEAVSPPEGGKYARMGYNMLLRKGAFVSAVVIDPEPDSRVYRQVDFSVVLALERKGLVSVDYLSGCDGWDGVFQLIKKEA